VNSIGPEGRGGVGLGDGEATTAAVSVAGAAGATVVDFLQEAQCGDLAFFDNDEGRITHTGIMLSSETIIHASGRVRIDGIDNMGIINSDTGKRTHKLRVVKRFI